jgi:DNA-directed RNA polymerase specialized sigma24 family protein
MGQFGRRSTYKGRSIPNPFGIELPRKLDPVVLDGLVAWHRFGMATKDEIDEIFMSHVRLGIAIAGEYGWRAKHLINDLVSVAMLGIAEAIHKAPVAMVDNNITPYITTRVRGVVTDFVQSQHITASRTLRRKLAENPTWVQPFFDTLSKAHDRATGLGDSSIEILECIEHCVGMDANLQRREYKRASLRLRAAGYNNAEVAGILEISEAYVQSLVSDVRREYEKEYPLNRRKKVVNHE